jgi:hypothetical protein
MAQHQRDPAKEASWRGLVQRFTSSGLSVREFCRREQLTESSFYAWRRTISERDVTRSPGTVFVSAILTPSHSQAFSPSEPSLALELTGGCVLRFVGPTAAEQLADLIHALQARSVR